MIWRFSGDEADVSSFGHARRVNAISLSGDGRGLASASEDRTIRLWDMTTGAELRVLDGHTAGVTAVAMTPDGKRVVSFGDDLKYKLWTRQMAPTSAAATGRIRSC